MSFALYFAFQAPLWVISYFLPVNPDKIGHRKWRKEKKIISTLCLTNPVAFHDYYGIREKLWMLSVSAYERSLVWFPTTILLINWREEHLKEVLIRWISN